ASVISVAERRVIQTIALPGRPRWAAFDRSADRVHVNIQSPAVILSIDAGVLMESGRIDVGADGPHGLAFVSGRFYCAADSGELVVIDWFVDGPRVTKRLPLRGAPDVVMHDARLDRLYVAIGSPGIVTVFDGETLAELETIDTELGAH